MNRSTGLRKIQVGRCAHPFLRTLRRLLAGVALRGQTLSRILGPSWAPFWVAWMQAPPFAPWRLQVHLHVLGWSLLVLPQGRPRSLPVVARVRAPPSHLGGRVFNKRPGL